MTTFTVGLPVYNAMPYLPQTVDSVLSQTYRDFELLIIDDGSTDSGWDYLETLSDSRLRIVKQNNRGLAATLNRMLEDCSTPWLVRQDADDIAYPHRMRVVAEHVSRFPSAGMFHTFADHYCGGPRLGRMACTRGGPDVHRNVVRAGYLLGIAHPTVVLNVKKTLAIGGYRPEIVATEDADLWWRMALNFDIRLIEESTINIRLAPAGNTSRNLLKQAQEALYVQYLLLSHLWGPDPIPMESFERLIAPLIDRRRLRYRERIRRAAVAAAERRWVGSASEFLIAGAISPRDLFERVSRPTRQSAAVVAYGLDPRKFAARSQEFWPAAGL